MVAGSATALFSATDSVRAISLGGLAALQPNLLQADRRNCAPALLVHRAVLQFEVLDGRVAYLLGRWPSEQNAVCRAVLDGRWTDVLRNVAQCEPSSAHRRALRITGHALVDGDVVLATGLNSQLAPTITGALHLHSAVLNENGLVPEPGVAGLGLANSIAGEGDVLAAAERHVAQLLAEEGRPQVRLVLDASAAAVCRLGLLAQGTQLPVGVGGGAQLTDQSHRLAAIAEALHLVGDLLIHYVGELSPLLDGHLRNGAGVHQRAAPVGLLQVVVHRRTGGRRYSQVTPNSGRKFSVTQLEEVTPVDCTARQEGRSFGSDGIKSSSGPPPQRSVMSESECGVLANASRSCTSFSCEPSWFMTSSSAIMNCFISPIPCIIFAAKLLPLERSTACVKASIVSKAEFTELTGDVNVGGSGAGAGGIAHRARVEAHVAGDAVADDQCALLATAGNADSTGVMQWLVVLEPLHRRLGHSLEGALHANVIARRDSALLQSAGEDRRLGVQQFDGPSLLAMFILRHTGVRAHVGDVHLIDEETHLAIAVLQKAELGALLNLVMFGSGYP
ncbi:hypothetical protein TYRP_007235 [Tyrophagus putrescentiae]|nr:hypothetical protein TYRP_007235 [Tyrophagus putrescentiae]